MDTMQQQGNEPEGQPEGKTGTCVKVYIGEDGSFSVGKTEDEPIPDDAQPAQSLDDALMMAKDMASAPPSDQDEMAQAQAGYNRKAQGGMSAPNPGGVFGE
jgi:hypothetical protein